MHHLHVCVERKGVIEAATLGLTTILLDPEPPSSTDSYILDENMLTGIQSFQYEAAPSDVEEQIAAIQKHMRSAKKQLIDDNFIKELKSMDSGMCVGGGNSHQLPLFEKAKQPRNRYTC